MHGVKRVIVFCIMTTILPTILIVVPLYLRHSLFADVTYTVAESDIITIVDGVSSVFCESHSLKMNSSFSAFQSEEFPIKSNKRKHIRLKKSMILPDDTLEYWGFYLLKGATVTLKVCSRYEGSRILVVRGERFLKTCGLLEHNIKKFGATLDKDHNQVKVTFDAPAQEIIGQEDEDAGVDKNKGSEVSSIEVTDFIKRKLGKNKNITERLPRGYINDNNYDKNNKNKNRTYVSHINDIQNVNFDKNTENLILTNEQIQKDIDLKQEDSDIKQEDIGMKQDDLKVKQINIDIKQVVDMKQKYINFKPESNSPKKHNKRHIHSKHHGLTRSKHKKHSKRHRRDIGQILDGKISHGGNAINYTDHDESSTSSFETSLLTCYNGQILLTQDFLPSESCTDVHYLEKSAHLEAVHEVASDGYYYYIFYSDNDIVSNDIHAVFDIYKPTYQYTNMTKSKGCINKTECNFPISFWSNELVIVEIPTKDGIEHEDDDISYLVSTCHPRMSVYMIFPITVMFLIMGCAFL